MSYGRDGEGRDGGGVPEKMRRKGPVRRGQLGGSEGGDSAPSGSVEGHFESSLRGVLNGSGNRWGGFEGEEKRGICFFVGCCRVVDGYVYEKKN